MPAGRGAAYYSQVLRPSGRNPAGQSWPTTEQVEAQLQVLRLKGEYPRRAANPNVARYVQSRVLKIQNPKSAKFVDVARSFNKTWGDDLGAFMEDGRKETIDAIIANRHQIAHGGDSGITVARVSDYLRKSISVIEFIEAQCGF